MRSIGGLLVERWRSEAFCSDISLKKASILAIDVRCGLRPVSSWIDATAARKRSFPNESSGRATARICFAGRWPMSVECRLFRRPIVTCHLYNPVAVTDAGKRTHSGADRRGYLLAKLSDGGWRRQTQTLKTGAWAAAGGSLEHLEQASVLPTSRPTVPPRCPGPTATDCRFTKLSGTEILIVEQFFGQVTADARLLTKQHGRCTPWQTTNASCSSWR